MTLQLFTFLGFVVYGYLCAERGDSFVLTMTKGVVILAIVTGIVFLSGCATTVKHEVPQLDGVSAAMKKIVIADCTKPTLAMPPIPMECVIDIQGDVLTASSQDCENLIRFYVRARSLLKPAAPVSSNPQ